MGLIRRATLSLATAVIVAATVTIVSVGAAGGFGFGPGKFTFNDTSAFTSFFDPATQANVNVSVDRSLFMFRPRAGGPVQTQNMTVLSVNIFTPNPDPTQPPVVSDNGCFIIPDSAFVVSSDLQSASINATVDATNLCPGFLVPLTGAAPGAAKGGGGGGTGFTFPLTVSATWTGTGAVTISENQGTMRCEGFVSITHNHNQSVLSAFVTTSISGIGSFSGGRPFAFGNVSVSANVQDVAGTGILSAACGGGKGG